MDRTAEELIARLRQSPDDQEAFKALRAHYQRTGDSASLANLLEGWAARQRDAALASAAFFEAAELVQRHVRDLQRAASLYEKALEKDPRHPEAHGRLVGLIESSGDTRKLLELLQRRSTALARLGDSAGRAEVELRIGQLYEHKLARPDRAIAHYRKAFEADPGMVPAIYAAREIYRNAGNLKAAASLFELEIKAEPTAVRRVALLRELAHLRMHELKDLAGAVDTLQRAVTEVPGDLAVIHELATALLMRAEQRGEGAAADQERGQAADLMYQLAQSTPLEHAIAYCESALDAVPSHDGAMELLERLADEQARPEILPIRWVGYLQAAPAGPDASRRRKLLGFAYAEAGQDEDAIVCLEPLLDEGDAEAAETLVELYRAAGRTSDANTALGVAVQGLPAERRVPRLQEIIDGLVEEGDMEAAVARARELFAIDPGNETALDLLERHFRREQDHLSLRDLMLGASRVGGITPEARRHRLREVARLSEGHLEDPDGAIAAWQALVAVDPTDDEAQTELGRLLETRGRWDELVQIIEKQALTAIEPDVKVELLRKLVTIHREHREDPQTAIQALRSLREIRPDDEDARNALQEVLLETDEFKQALPLLEERINTSIGDEKVRLLGLLADTYETRLGDDERAFAATARILDEDPSNLDALDRMERIDTRNENLQRLVDTLSYRCEVVTPEQRAVILARIGQILDERLEDLERAADFYQRALDLDAENVVVLDALCSVFDRAGRYKDLVVLLRERARVETDIPARSELYRRIARTLAERVRNEDAAAEAWERVLEAGEDEEALRALRAHAQYRGDGDALEGWLGRLAEVSPDEEERRDLRLEQADVLASLERPNEAVSILRTQVLAMDPAHLGAIQRLGRLCELLEDDAGLADALERQLDVIEDPGLRQPLAVRLADLYEGPLDTPDKAIDALYRWVECDPMDVDARKRLVTRLDRAERWEELVGALDGLASAVIDPEEEGVHIRRAAEVAARRMTDWDAAWTRLAPRVGDDELADAMLRQIADDAKRHAQLAELFVQLAQGSQDPDVQRRRWTDASRVFEGPLGDAAKALEAMLRAYATDLADESMLGDVDRLAARADAWPRLAQVYERLLKTVESHKAKRKLLMRHAKLLDEVAQDPSESLDRVLRACALVPEDDDVLRAAEELAPRAGRSDELLIVYDRRRQKAGDDAARIDALLRAARLCDDALQDRERAFQYIAPAIALTVRSPELIDVVEACVTAMDERRPEMGNDDAKRTLIGVYTTIADGSEDAPVAGAELLLRAARILDDVLSNAEEAFELRLRAASYAAIPHVLDDLEAASDRLEAHDRLDQHFARLIEDALDQDTASDLLLRRGRRLEALGRWDPAADVFRRLLMLRKDDIDAADHLLSCLRQAGKHQDLLVALDRQIARASDDERRLALLREAADVWEKQLGNKWEALDVWKKVLAERPEDAAALEAAERLGHSTRHLETDFDDEPAAPLTEEIEEIEGGPDTAERPLDELLDQADEADDDAPVTRELAPEDLAQRDAPFAGDGESTAPSLPSVETFGFDEYTVAETEASLDDEFGEVESPAAAPVGLAFEDTQLAPELESGDDVEEVPVREDGGTSELDLAELDEMEEEPDETPFLPIALAEADMGADPFGEEPALGETEALFQPLDQADEGTGELLSDEVELVDDSSAYEIVDDDELDGELEELLDDDDVEELDAADLLEEEPLRSVPPPPPTSIPPPPPTGAPPPPRSDD